MVFLTSSEENSNNLSPDVDAIPANLMRWEYLLIGYLAFASYLVWYVSENLLVWEPKESIWGLPKPIAGALMIALTWIVLNFVLFVTYYVVITKRVKTAHLVREGRKS
jgi:hypothetical protein